MIVRIAHGFFDTDTGFEYRMVDTQLVVSTACTPYQGSEEFNRFEGDDAQQIYAALDLQALDDGPKKRIDAHVLLQSSKLYETLRKILVANETSQTGMDSRKAMEEAWKTMDKANGQGSCRICVHPPHGNLRCNVDIVDPETGHVSKCPCEVK